MDTFSNGQADKQLLGFFLGFWIFQILCSGKTGESYFRAWDITACAGEEREKRSLKRTTKDDGYTDFHILTKYYTFCRLRGEIDGLAEQTTSSGSGRRNANRERLSNQKTAISFWHESGRTTLKKLHTWHWKLHTRREWEWKQER